MPGSVYYGNKLSVTTMDAKQFILQEIRRVAEEIAPERLGIRAFRQASSISTSKIRYHFGSWNRALEEAGLGANPPSVPLTGYKKIPNTELLDAIGELWVKFGRRPTRDLMDSDGRFSHRPYSARWGTFGKAVDAFVHERGEPNGSALEKVAAVPQSKQLASQTVIIPKTFKPERPQPANERVFVGEPLDFRGLRYAPVNEQGVVYLFGMVSRELGFLVESVRTSFPDCEGKRCLDSEGTRWQHVRIEFEYKSSNFREHAHDATCCEIIVSWIHDWQDCPVEVLELKSAIRQLPKR